MTSGRDCAPSAFVIAFAVNEKTVEIHGILYGGQNYEALIKA